MITWTKPEKYQGMYTETHRTVIKNGAPVVKVVTCCCGAAGRPRYICARERNLKNPCRCHCHSETL